MKAVVAILLCIPEILSLMPKLMGFNFFSNSITATMVLLCFAISIGLAVSSIRKGNDAAWTLGFVTLAIHIGVLAKFLPTSPADF